MDKGTDKTRRFILKAFPIAVFATAGAVEAAAVEESAEYEKAKYHFDELVKVLDRLSFGANGWQLVAENRQKFYSSDEGAGLHGVYHHASPKHLDRYVAEFTFRLNDGAVQRHTLDRLSSMFSAAIGQRLTYKDLIA